MLTLMMKEKLCINLYSLANKPTYLYRLGNSSWLSAYPTKCQNVFCNSSEHIHNIDQIKKNLQKISVNLQKILANLQNIPLNLHKYKRISAEI